MPLGQDQALAPSPGVYNNIDRLSPLVLLKGTAGALLTGINIRGKNFKEKLRLLTYNSQRKKKIKVRGGKKVFHEKKFPKKRHGRRAGKFGTHTVNIVKHVTLMGAERGSMV